MRYAIEISYLGSAFAGWQFQPGAVTVQESLEKALTLLNGSPVRVTGAGRTDSGVHGKGQVASFDMVKCWEPYRLMLALNDHIPDSMSVMRVSPVSEDFDARRSALWREYVYFIWHGPACYPQLKPFVWWRKKDDWDHERVRECCSMLPGSHDFGAFCKLSEKPENCRRTVLRTSYVKKKNLSIFRIRGTAFLTNMVRIIVGNLDSVGCKAKSPEWFRGLLEGGSRNDSAMTAPSSGLFFWRVGYDEF